MQDKKKKKGFPDLNKDGKVTFKDILIGRGVVKKAKGGSLKGGQKKLDANKDGKISGDDFAMLRGKKSKDRGMGLQDEKLPPGKMVKANIGAMIGDQAGMAVAEPMSPEDRMTQIDIDYAEARSKSLPALQEYKRKSITPKERREKDIAKRAEKKMGGGMLDSSMGYQKGGSVMARGYKLTRSKPTKLY